MQDTSSKQQTKQKYKPNHQQTGLPPHSALRIGGKANKQTNKKKNKPKKPSTNLTLYEAYTNHLTNLRRAEMKMKKEFNLEGRKSSYCKAYPKSQSLKTLGPRGLANKMLFIK